MFHGCFGQVIAHLVPVAEYQRTAHPVRAKREVQVHHVSPFLASTSVSNVTNLIPSNNAATAL